MVHVFFGFKWLMIFEIACEISILPRWSSHGGNGMISQLRRLSTHKPKDGLSTGCWQTSRNDPGWFDGEVSNIINKCIRLVVYSIHNYVRIYIYIYTHTYHVYMIYTYTSMWTCNRSSPVKFVWSRNSICSKGSHLCDLEMHGIYLNNGTTESPQLIKVGVFKSRVFQDGVTLKGLDLTGFKLLEYLLVPWFCLERNSRITKSWPGLLGSILALRGVVWLSSKEQSNRPLKARKTTCKAHQEWRFQMEEVPRLWRFFGGYIDLFRYWNLRFQHVLLGAGCSWSYQIWFPGLCVCVRGIYFEGVLQSCF